MSYVSSNNGRHPVTKTFTTPHYTSPNYTSLSLHFTSLHVTSSHLNLTHLHFTTLSFGLSPLKFLITNAHYWTQSHFGYMHLPYLRLAVLNAVYLISCLVAKPQGSTLLLSKPTTGHDPEAVPSNFPLHYTFR